MYPSERVRENCAFLVATFICPVTARVCSAHSASAQTTAPSTSRSMNSSSVLKETSACLVSLSPAAEEQTAMMPAEQWCLTDGQTSYDPHSGDLCA